MKQKEVSALRRNAAIRSVTRGLAVVMTRHGFDSAYYFTKQAQRDRSSTAWREKGYAVRPATLDDVNAAQW